MKVASVTRAVTTRRRALGGLDAACYVGGVLALLLLAAGATATSSTTDAPWEWRASAGGQIDAASHGVVDLGVRRGPWSLQLFTDTLDGRYEDRGDQGRWWIGARGEVGAAGLFISRWANGTPDASRSFLAFYGGLDAGWVHYLPAGTYVGIEGSVRRWFFAGRDDTKVTVPKGTWVTTPNAVAGWWSPWAEIFVRGGADLVGSDASPKIWGEAKLHPSMTLAPFLEVRAGWSKDQSDITKTRVGGLNPYVVPLGGAGWAEWWVERYAAVRAGPELQLPWGRAAIVFDGVKSDVIDAWGLAALARGYLGALFLEGQVGYAPDIPRTSGTGRTSVWILVGFDWHAL